LPQPPFGYALNENALNNYEAIRSDSRMAIAATDLRKTKPTTTGATASTATRAATAGARASSSAGDRLGLPGKRKCLHVADG